MALLGSPGFKDPHSSQKHAGLQHAVCLLQQEETRPKSRFKQSTSRNHDSMFNRNIQKQFNCQYDAAAIRNYYRK